MLPKHMVLLSSVGIRKCKVVHLSLQANDADLPLELLYNEPETAVDN